MTKKPTTKKGWPFGPDNEQRQMAAVLANQKTMLANQQTILQKLQSLSTYVQMVSAQESKMAVDLTALTAELTNNTNATQAVTALVKALAAQIAAIPASSDPVTQAALDGLVATLTSNDQVIANAVTANTPAAPGTVPPLPATP